VSLELRTDGTRAVLTVHGPWNRAGHIEGLEETVDDLLRRGCVEFVLHLEGVSHIDSRGLGQLVQVYAAIARSGGRLQIVGLTKTLDGLLSAVKLPDGSR
jgi:anti-anti-sigma factor